MSSLLVDFCTFEAAKYAVSKWHYLGKMPIAKCVKLGVWEDGSFIGAIVFGYSAGANIHKSYDLGFFEITELTRVALGNIGHTLVKLCREL